MTSSRTWSDEDLGQAVRDHFRLQLVSVGHLAPRGSVHVTDHAVLSSVGAPSLYNRGTALDLEQPDVAFGEIEAFYDGLPHTLWIEDDPGEDVEALMTARGYVRLPDQHGMACTRFPEGLAEADPDHHATLLADPAEAAEVAEVISSGFGAGVDDRLVTDDLARAVLRHAKPWDHGAIYGIRDRSGRLVSVGALLCTRDVAGLGALATVTGHRHHHHATAVASRALHDATALGYSVGVTVTTPESEHALQRLGFRTVMDYHVYYRRS